MAKQKGIIKLEGTINDVTFYKSQDGFLARGKGGVTADRINNDPAFQRTRENGQEFGRAGSAGRLLRVAFMNYLQNGSDNRMVSRLTKAMLEVVKADATSTRGQRNVLDGELEMLEGFDFNINGKLSATLYASYTTNIDRPSGNITLSIPYLVPANMITAPTGTTHIKIYFAGAEIDFENETFNINSSDTTELGYDTNISSTNLTCTLTANSTHPLFAVIGVGFYQEVNGVKYPLKNGFYNTLAIAKVSGV